ncbi:hypothetical protein CSUB01_03527 [Colletotrichum sublineola]|uniref:Involucrin repeat protein n=1 Tax=Colletotrichum sublineola TaxID=1173701 RepID=A0A066XC50_COLSU|nr:hypothetical protein CSUB01_03527 [Colletotrichum sublineola]
MRDPRRRSPESSRRRRRDRRDSREQLATGTNLSTPLPQMYSQSQYPQFYPDPQRYPEPERYAARPERYDDPQRYGQPQPQSYPHPEQYPPTDVFVNPLGYTEQQPYVEPQTYQQPREPERMRPRGGSSSSSAPSEQLNSDMAYGRGYIERDKSQRPSPMPQAHPSPALYRGDLADASHRPPPAPRDKTDEEILNIGRQLQDIARRQNQADLKAASKSRTSQVAGAAAAAVALSHFRPKSKSDSKTRVSGTSKPNQSASSSDDDWESASEDESTTDESDSGLVYGSVFKPAKSARISSESPEQIKPPERKSTIVDPRLFGPVNSLRGAVKSPCGFGEQDPRSAGSSRRHHEETIAQVELPKTGKQPMQRIYPVPTSDPDRFDYDRGSVASSRQDLPQRARPEPVPIQQPIPIVPVSSKVYDAERFEEDERTKQRRSPPKGRSVADNAIAGVGVAAAAIGAAMAYNRRDSGDHDERRDDRPSETPKRQEGPRDPRQSRRRDEPEQPIRVELEDRETRKHDDTHRSHRRNDADVVDERDKKRATRSDPAYEALKRRASDRDPRPEVYRLPQGDEIRVEYEPNDNRRPREEPREARRDERKTVVIDERPEARRVEEPTELPRDKHGFQVVTVDREPSFDDSPPRKPDYSESRMSRKDSFELEQRLEKYQQGAQDRSRTPGPRRRGNSIEEEERAAKSIYDEAKHATAPIAAAAIAAAIAAESERSRKHRRDQVTEDGSQDKSQAAKDAVQEEADRYYRETAIARKIAKDEMRSRSASPHEESVVGKWQEHDDRPEVVTIVTPPEMEHHHHDKSPYDAPNADVRIDYVIIPEELDRFRLPGRQLAAGEAPKFQSRDPSCERERPLLNLVLPTPVVTPQHTPAPEHQKERSSSSRKQEGPEPKSVEPVGAPASNAVPATEIVLGPRGEAIERPATPTAKSVTWGENETKSFNIESPEPPRKTSSSTSSKSKKKKKLGKSSPWGIISAAVGAGAAVAAAAPDMRDPFESKPDEDRERHSPSESPKSRGTEPIAEPTDLPTSYKRSEPFGDEHDLPPAPGPKPSSPQTTRMPGAFADDIEFASVLAAGLQDTGFDPNIVIDNPTYMRRDSPPGQSEPAVYQQPYAETVTDLGIYGSEGPVPADSGFVIGEVPETPVAERDVENNHATESPRTRERRDKGKAKETPLVEKEPPFEDVESPKKLSKKEKRKQKAAKRQSMDDAPADETYDTPVASSRSAPIPSSEAPPAHERPRSYYDVPGVTPQNAPAILNDSGPVYERPHTYYGYGGPQPTPLSGPHPYSNAISAHERPHTYYGVPEMTFRNEPAPLDQAVPRYEKPRAFYDTPQSPETVVALGPKDRGFQDVPTWDLPATSDVPHSYGETLASAASASETAPADYEPVAPSKLSKKEKKRKSKSSKSEVIVVQEDEDELPTERSLRGEPSASCEGLSQSERYHSGGPQETGEDAWETLAKKQSKKSKQSSDEWTDVEKQSDYTPTVERSSARDDLEDWDDLPTKSRRDRSRFEDRDVSSVVSDPSSRREKSDRRSKSSRHEDKNASSVVISDPTSRREKSDRRSKNVRDEDRDAGSVVSDPSSCREKSERRSYGSRHDDGDVTSVVSEPTSRSEKSERRSKSLRDEERDTGSVVSDRSSRRDKSDRRSNGTRHEDGDDVKSVASGSSGRKKRSDDQKSPKEEEKRSSGFFNSLFRGGNNKEVSGKDEKSSFLDNAGTLGAGVGLAGAVAALGSIMSRSNATEPHLEESVDVPRSLEMSASPARDVDIDPEIVPRDIRPAIDPQYGDLLPLPPSPMPPSTPGSPTQELDEELPALPDSRPETPPEERRQNPARSPSQTAVPFKLRLGQRPSPSSPSNFGPSPVSSPPVATAPDAAHITTPTSARRPSRPISWESSPQSMEPPIDLPELPPSEPSSRESPAPEFSLREDDVKYFNQLQASPFEPNDLRIDTNMSQYPEQANRQLGSQETTPKAEYAIQHAGAMFERASPALPELPDAAKYLDLSEHDFEELPPLPASPLDTPVMGSEAEPANTISQERSLHGPVSPALPTDTDADRQSTFSHATLTDLPALPASPISDTAESLQQPVIPTSKLEELPAIHDSPLAQPTMMPEPEPVETTSKERSSYLLHMTPPSIIKNLMDRDTLDTPPSPTPDRSYDATVDTAEIEEQDLSGSHNTALAALAGGAAAGLAAASLIDHANAEDKSKKDKKKNKKKAKGMSIDNTTLPSGEPASAVSTDKNNSPSIDTTPSPMTEPVSSISVEHDESPSVDTVPAASTPTEDTILASTDGTKAPSIEAMPTPNEALPPLPPVSAEETVSLSDDADPAASAGENALPSIQDHKALEPTDKAPQELADPLVLPTDISLSAEGDAAVVRVAAADGEVTGPAAAELLAEDTAGRKKLSKKEKKKLQKIKKAWEQAQAEMQKLERSAEPDEETGKAALDTDAPISSLPEPAARAMETNEAEEAAAVPLPNALDPAEEEALLESETIKEMTEAQEVAGTQLPDISEPDLETPLLQFEKVPVTTDAEQAASVPLPEDSEPTMENSLLSDDVEKAQDTQKPEQPESASEFKGPIATQEEAQTALPDFGSSKDAVEAGLPATPLVLDPLVSDAKKSKKKKKKGKKSVDDESSVPSLAPEALPESSLSAGPAPDHDEKPLDAMANFQSEQQASVVEPSSAKDGSPEQELPLQPLEEETVEPIEVTNKSWPLPPETLEKSFGPSDDLDEQQTTVQDQSDKSVEQDVMSSELQFVSPTQDSSSKLDADPSEQQTATTQTDNAPAITGSQQEQPALVPETSPPAGEPAVDFREVEKPTETPSAPLSKKQKKKLKKSRKSLAADDEHMAAIENRPTEPQPEPAADQVPSTSNLDLEPKEASISEANPADPVADSAIAAAPIEHIVDDASGPVQAKADAAATPLPEDATEALEEIPEKGPEPDLTEVASMIPLPEDTPTGPKEASEQAATKIVAPALPVSEDAAEKTTTTGLETYDNGPIVHADGKPTPEPVPASVEAPPAEAAQPDSSGKKKKKKKKGKGASLSQLDDVMSAETTSLQSPGVQTPNTQLPVDEPFGAEALVTDSRAIGASIAEPSANEVPTSATPSVETSAVETPSVEIPAVETPAETPIDETPVGETPVVESPVVETPVAETPAIEVSLEEPPTEALEAASSTETPTAESAPSSSALAENLPENPSVDESVKSQPTDISPTETQQVENTGLQTNEAGLATDKAAAVVDMPETSISSLVPDEQTETPTLAEDTVKSSKKSKKKKKKKAAEAEPEVAAVVADDIPTNSLDITSHNFPVDEKPVDTDGSGTQELVTAVDRPHSGDVNVTDFAAEDTLITGPQTPTMSESQDEAFVTPPQGPATPESHVEAFENFSQEPTLIDSQIGSFDAKPQEPRTDEDQDRGLDSPAEPKTSTSSKKSKKKAKKEAAAAAAAAVAATAATVLEPETGDAAKDSDDKKEAKDETITDSGISNTISDKLGEMEQSSQEPPTSGEFATDSKISEEADPGPTVTKKGKKKKKGKKSSTLDLEPENSPSTSTLETTTDVANTREQSAYVTSPSGEPGSDETRFSQADAPIEAELPASATASKKKRKSVTWAPELESFSTSPKPPPHQENEDSRLGDVSATETAPASETPFETEAQLRQDESVAGGSPEAIGGGQVVASQGIEMEQIATPEAEKDLGPEGQAQMRHASEPSDTLPGLQDTTSPNPGDGLPSSSGLETTRGVADEPIATQQTDMLPTPASSSICDVKVANRESGETLSPKVDAEQEASAEADATGPEPAGRPDTIDEPSAGASAQTGEVDIPDPSLHAAAGPVSGSVNDTSLGDTQSGRIADAQAVGPALTDSALEAGDPQDTPVMALANQDDTNTEIPQPLDHVPVPGPVVVGKISDAGITDASTAENLPLGDEQQDNISNVQNKEAAEDAEKDEKEDLDNPLATDAALAGLSDNPESLGEPITSEPQLEPLSETLPGPEATGDVSTTQDPDQTETPAGQEDGFRSEPPSSSKMSKKDKKTRKKTKTSSAEPAPQHSVQDVKKQIVDDGAPAVQAIDEQVQAPEQAGPEPSPGVTDALEVEPVTEAVEAGEDEWAIQPSGKKSKKDKKKRAAAEVAAATGQSNEPALETPAVTDEARAPSQPALDEASKIGVASDEQATPVDTTETSADAPEVQESKESTETVSPVENATAEVHTPPAQSTSDIPGNSVTTDEKPEAPEEADVNGFELAKKSKKDKKKKKKQSISWDDGQELALPAAQPEEFQTSEGITTTVPASPENTFLSNTEAKPAQDLPSATEAAAEDLQKTLHQDESTLKSEEPAATTQVQDPTTIKPIDAPAADNSEGITPELPLDQLKDTGSAPQTDLETLGDGMAPLQDEEFPAITKKSKKDKKKKKGLASTSTPDEAPATPESELVDQPALPAADQISEPTVISPETPQAEDQSPKAVEEVVAAEAAPTTQPPLVSSEGPVIEEKISTPTEEDISASKKSKKDKKKKKKGASIDTPEEHLPAVEAESAPGSTIMSQTAETLEEPAPPAIDETTQLKSTSAEELAPAPEGTQPTEEKPTEAEPTQDEPVSETPVVEAEQPKTEVDPFAGLSKKAKKKKMAQMTAAENDAVAETPTRDPEETVKDKAAEAPIEGKPLEEQPAGETPVEQNPVPEPESAVTVEKAAEMTLEPSQAEVDPFAGLSKKTKKKKLAQMAAAEAEAAAALTPPVETEKAPEETIVEEGPATENAVEETSAEKAVTEVATAEAEQKITETLSEEVSAEDKPAEREMLHGNSSKDEIQAEKMPVAEQQSTSLKVEKDPFAGLSKKEKKKKKAELAAAEKAAAEANAKAAEEKSVDNPPVEAAVEDKTVEKTPAELKPAQESLVSDKPTKTEHAEEVSATEAPQTEDPFDGLSEKEKEKPAAEVAATDSVSEPISVETTQTAEEKPAETMLEDKSVQEKPSDALVEDKPVEENAVEKPEHETPIVEVDPFAGLSKKQKKKKMAEMAKAAAAAAAATETKEVVEDMPADSQTDNASKQDPALGSKPPASAEDTSKDDSVPAPLEEAPQSADIANPEDFPVPEKETKKDKKRKGTATQSDPVVEPVLKQPIEKQPEQQLEPELQAEVPPSAQTEVQSTSLEIAHPETTSDDEVACLESTMGIEQLPTAEKVIPDPEIKTVQSADPEQQLPLTTGKNAKKAKGRKDLTDLEPEPQSPNVALPQDNQSPAIKVPATEVSLADQPAVAQPEDLPVESQTRSVGVENLPDALAAPNVNTDDGLPLTGKAKKAKKKKGKSLDLSEPEPSTETAPEITEPVTEPVVEPVAELIADPVAEPAAAPPTELSSESSNCAEATVLELSSAMPPTPLEQSADQPAQSETVVQTNDDNLSAPKLSKKDKKKKKRGKLQDDFNPPSGAATPTMLEASDPFDIPTAGQSIPDTSPVSIPSPEPADLSRGPLLETSATQDNTIGEVAEETPLASDLLSSKTTQEAPPEPKSPNSVDNNTSAEDTVVVEPAFPATPEESTQIAPESATPDPEEHFPTPTKKSKKDKKKKKGKSTDTIMVEPEGSTPPTPGLEQDLTDDVQAKEASVTEAEAGFLPTETAPTDIPTKTSSEVPVEAAFAEVAAETPIVAASEAPAEVAVEPPKIDDESPLVQKKSKKDKKKRKDESQDDSEIASGTATPAEILDPESQAKQSHDMSVEPALASRDMEPPSVISEFESTTSQDHPQAEDRPAEETLATTELPAPLNDPVQDVGNVAVKEPQPPAEEGWPEATPAKKSKKDKKKNRKSKAGDDFDLGSGTATPLEATTEEALTTGNNVASDLPIVEPPIAATAPEVPAQDLVHEIEEEPRLLVHETTPEQFADEKLDAPTKSETLTLEPEKGVDEPVVIEEPQEFVVKKSKKDKKKRKSALVEPETTVLAIDESSTSPEDHATTHPVQEPNAADPATKISVIESTEDTTAPAEEWPEVLTSNKGDNKQSLLVEPEVIAEALASSTSLAAEPQTVLSQDDQPATTALPDALLHTNTNAGTLTNEPEPSSEHGPEIVPNTPDQQPQVETAEGAVDRSSDSLPLKAQPIIENREVDEAFKADIEDLPADAPATPPEEPPEIATTKKNKKDKKRKKRQSLSLDAPNADSPLQSGTATPQIAPAEEETASKPKSGTSLEAPADEVTAKSTDGPLEQPAAEENVVTAENSAEPLEFSEPIPTSEILASSNKLDDVIGSQRELEPRVKTEDAQTVEPPAKQLIDDTFPSTDKDIEPIQSSTPPTPAPDTTESTEPVPYVEQTVPEAISRETSQDTRGMDDVPQELITEDVVKKRPNKDKKKTKRLSFADELEMRPEEQAAADTPTMVESSTAATEASTNIAETATGAATDNTRSFEEEDHQAPTILAPETVHEPAAAGDDEWDVYVTKKSKKGKKSKKQSISLDPQSPVNTALDCQQDSVVPGPAMAKSEGAEDKIEYFDDAPRDITRSPTAPSPPEPAAALESPAEFATEGFDTTDLPPTSNEPVGVDLTPAQETSSVIHEVPFDQSEKRKKMKTRELSNTLLPEPIVSSGEIAAVYVDGDHRDPAEKASRAAEQRSLPTPEPDTPRDLGPAERNMGEDAPQQEPNISSARDMAASYLELENDHTMDEPIQLKTVEKQPDSKSSGMGIAAGITAAAAGAAVLASKSSSAKKGKKSKYEDKRASQEEDMFDDPSLWEGADRKQVSEAANADAENFWGGDEAADHEQMTRKPADANVEQEGKSELVQPSSQDMEVQKADVVSSPTSRGLNIYSGQPREVTAHTAELVTSPAPRAFEIDNTKDKLKDIPSLAAPFKEKALDDNVESPILGRDTGTEAADGMSMNNNQEESLSWGAKTSKTDTMVSDMDEAVDRGFEAETRRDLSGGRPPKSPERGFEVAGFRSPVPTILPPVQEEAHEGAETEHRLLYRPASRTTLGSPDPTRDSGFTTGSPHPFRRSGFDEDERDSGVQLREWQDQRSPGRGGQRTPELKSYRSERRRSRDMERAKSPTDRAAVLRSPFAEGETRDHPLSKTPVLREPTGRELTPEPQKYRRTVSPELERKRSKYQDLASAALAGAAISSTCSSPRSTPPPGNRSVSDRVARLQSPATTEPVARRSMSNSSLSRHRRAMGTPTPEPLKFRPESPGIQRSGTATPPLRRVDRRVSGDLRSLSQRSQLDLTKDPKDPTSSSNAPVANEGRVRTKDMADVYDGFGEGRIGSPRSPTRPHSMRRRQSMQVLELESRVEQLMAENRMLADARAHAESHNSNRASGILAERDAEIDVLKQSLEFLQKEVARLTEVNEGLNSANAQLAAQHNERYRSLETQHADTSRRLEEARTEQGHFQESLLQKDAEIGRLRSELEAAKDKIRQMQRQILATKGADSDFLNVKDIDHFDHRCQQLCSHVQQWVLRFSKFSDMRSCRMTSEINDEKVIDRLDNSILDGTDVDTYLADRVKRRDVFMSMTMNMIWEFVFTRYLFGMDREQRQKLKSLEKLLTEVGPPRAVRQWRAVTLTLLSKRPSFKHQRDLDTEAVVQAIFQTLSKVLPPPSNLEDQIQSQLRRVMREAVDLSIEMRTQRAEYMMLPPLQPQYDADGELADTVTFNAALMNERSADKSVTNEVLEAQKAVVRIVLFPLVVKKGDDGGNNDDEIVVCPAQVLVARPKGGKAVRLFMPGSDAGGASISGQTAAMHSDISMGTFLPEQASNQ